MFLHSSLLLLGLALNRGELALNPVNSSSALGSQSLPTVVNVAQNRPSPPPKLPPNRVRPGGGLNSMKQSCKAPAEALTALIPTQNPVLTATAYPTLLFYIPDSAADIRLGKFSILSQDEKTRIYETDFTLQQAAGIIRIRLPQSPNYALQEGKSYRWYFKVYCQSGKDEQADLSVDGWLQRVALTPERQRSIELAKPDVWYDAVATLALQLQANPQDPKLRAQWGNLLRAIGMEDLAPRPLVDPVQVVELHR